MRGMDGELAVDRFQSNTPHCLLVSQVLFPPLTYMRQTDRTEVTIDRKGAGPLKFVVLDIEPRI